MNKTMQEMNEQYRDCPVGTYYIYIKKYIVKSHFIGYKKLDDVLYRIAFQKSYEKTLAKFGIMCYNSVE